MRVVKKAELTSGSVVKPSPERYTDEGDGMGCLCLCLYVVVSPLGGREERRVCCARL